MYQAGDALAAASHAFISGFQQNAALVAQNEKLTDENAALANENHTLLQKEKAVAALGDSGIIAGVVARPPESPYDTLVLAAGSNAGVTFGMEAFGAGGIPLGIVSSVLADFSRVTLFSAPGVVTNGWVGAGSMSLALTGSGAGTFSAVIPRAANVAVGDTVFISGPGALPVGEVRRIDSDPSAPSVTLRIAPALNLFSTTWVVLRDTGTAFSEMPACATSTLP